MKKMLAIEPVVPMSAIVLECEILAECDEKILTKNWKNEFMQLSPSTVDKDGRTIYRVEDANIDISQLKFGWMKGEDQCHLVSSLKTSEPTKRKKKKSGVKGVK